MPVLGVAGRGDRREDGQGREDEDECALHGVSNLPGRWAQFFSFRENLRSCVSQVSPPPTVCDRIVPFTWVRLVKRPLIQTVSDATLPMLSVVLPENRPLLETR